LGTIDDGETEREGDTAVLVRPCEGLGMTATARLRERETEIPLAPGKIDEDSERKRGRLN
jgi:hypothetical protein